MSQDRSRAGLARRLLSAAFDRFQSRLRSGSLSVMENLTRRLVPGAIIVLVVYAWLIGVAAVEFSRTPTASYPSRTRAT